MKKFIRTKDRIIAFGREYAYPTRIVKGNQHYIFTELTEATFEKMKDFNRWDILAEADTIEELCDEFVVYDTMNNICIDILGSFKSLKDDGWIHSGFDVFGAIWTSKGLIYVAKLNEEGDLVLI